MRYSRPGPPAVRPPIGAGVVESVDTRDLGSRGESRASSSLAARTSGTRTEDAAAGPPKSIESRNMEIKETAREGLKRGYKVTYDAADIEERIQKRLAELAKTVRLPGFRPGKVPIGLLRKRYGPSVLGEILEQVVEEGSRKVLTEHELKPALRPKVEVTSFDEGKDLEFSIDLEVLPEVPEVDLSAIELVRYTAEVDEERVRRSLENLAKAQRQYEAPEEPRPAREGDQVVIDFTGYRDGEKFEGGSASDLPVVLGSGSMLPGFEEGLVGKKPGEAFRLELTVPEDHPNKDLAGQRLVFEGTVKEVREPKPLTIDDELAEAYGFEKLEELDKAIRERLEQEYKQRAREKMKRQLLDHLAESYRFEVPQGMVDLEFETIWKQLTEEMERSGTGFESTGKSEEELRQEYRDIAERRVRLGLILSEIGNKNQIKVEAEELQQAMIREAQRYPGREREVFDFFRNNPGALEQLRAPLFEDKVVDFIFELAKIREEQVSVDALFEDPEDEENAVAGAEAAAEVAAAEEEAQPAQDKG